VVFRGIITLKTVKCRPKCSLLWFCGSGGGGEEEGGVIVHSVWSTECCHDSVRSVLCNVNDIT